MYFIFGRKTIAFVLTAALLMGAVLFAGNELRTVQTTAAASDWGLSFGSEGEVPRGNVGEDELKKLNALYVGDTSKKVLYLTFDAGYENGYTPHILDVLKKHNVKATFFLVGNYIKTAPDIVKRMVSEGHTVGNHTFTHPDMSSITDKDSFYKELNDLSELYKETVGSEMTRLYRPPQGKFSTDNLLAAKELGYKTVFWSLAYADWNNDDQPTKEQAFSKLIPRTHNGAVILLHSTSKTNSEIVDELLTKWEEMGYTFDKPENIT